MKPLLLLTLLGLSLPALADRLPLPAVLLQKGPSWNTHRLTIPAR